MNVKIKEKVLEKIEIKDFVNKLIDLTIQETAKSIFQDLDDNITDELDYPQKDYAYLLHKKGFEELKKKWLVV